MGVQAHSVIELYMHATATVLVGTPSTNRKNNSNIFPGLLLQYMFQQCKNPRTCVTRMGPRWTVYYCNSWL